MAAAAPMLPNVYQGVDKESAGYKLLASMGWREGEGLGAQKQGIKEHVKVKKKFDAMGVGAAEKAQHLRDWTAGMVGFDQILSKLKAVSAAPPTAGDGGSESDSSAETSPSRKGKKAASIQRTKQAPKDSKRKAPLPVSSDSSGGSDSDTSSSGSDSDQAGGGVRAPAVKRVKLASHVGRYGKRERAKAVQNYSALDLDAILGGITGGAAAAAGGNDADGGGLPRLTEIRPVHASSSDSEGDSKSDDEAAEEAGAKQAASRRLASIANGASASHGAGVDEFAGVDPSKRPWWASVFVRVGRMGSTKRELKGAKEVKHKVNIHGFKEEDQENLYEQVQNNAVHGRQGLGRADMPKKVAGARWCGTKTKLGSDDDDDEAGSGGEGSQRSGRASSSDDEEDAARVVVLKPKKERQQEGQQQQQQGQGQGGKQEDKVGKRRKQRGEVAAGGGEKPGKGAKDAAEAPAAAATPAPAAAAGGKQGSSKKRKEEAPPPLQQPSGPSSNGSGAAAAAAAAKGSALRKLAKKVLSDMPKRRMKLAKLHAALAESLGIPGGPGELSLDKVLKKLRASDTFSVCDKFVKLA